MPFSPMICILVTWTLDTLSLNLLRRSNHVC
nr:MAG TPA: hypothetical protein [Caudoviricetes sp.]